MAAMATIAQVCTALKGKLDGVAGLNVYDYPAAGIVAPAAVIVPGAPLEHSINRRTVTRNYSVLVMVPVTAEAAQHKTLTQMLDNYGASSLRTLLEADKSLGLTGVEAAHKGDSGVEQTTYAGAEYFASTITVQVTTQGDS